MSIQSGTFTVIHFKHIWFIGSWEQSALGDFYEYTAMKSSKLVVEEEVKSGSNVTWFFVLKRNDKVTVNYGDSQVHVPAQAVRIVPPWGSVGPTGGPSASRRKVERSRQRKA
jgi:hypothetical protein